METALLELLETVAIAISGLLIKKYVFLEPEMEIKKQRIFCMVSFLLIGIAIFAFGKDAAALATMFAIDLNICLSRKEHRLRGLLSMIPFLGIINGILVPMLFVPPYFFALSVKETAAYQFICYGVLTVLLAMFCVKGRNWRRWFSENMQHRRLRKSEKYLLWIIGLLMMLFSNNTTRLIALDSSNMRIADSMYGHGIAPFIGIAATSSFIATITIIVLIIQGNKRTFYHEQVSHMKSGMISFMAEVIESRDDNTGGHIRRTAEFVESIGQELKRQGIYKEVLTDEYINDMVVAAPLHDIGKIHIPDSVLNKPGKLTEEEFKIIRTHATTGAELLNHAKEELGESRYLHMAAEMAMYHHEWWNGKGYPYGISKEEIPLCARIMAVADVFDALTSKRCYKNAMPPEKACAIIREEAGTHFEPAVVEAFFTAMNNSAS